MAGAARRRRGRAGGGSSPRPRSWQRPLAPQQGEQGPVAFAHDPLPAAVRRQLFRHTLRYPAPELRVYRHGAERSEEHTSELQSRQYLVCRLLLEKKISFSSSHSFFLSFFSC